MEFVESLTVIGERDKDIYGAIRAYDNSKDITDWLKDISCLTKEPSYTSYTNIKADVDFIFYESGGMFEVVRTLDIPSYNKYLKGNICTLPHLLMPSDHLSLVAEFVVLE